MDIVRKESFETADELWCSLLAMRGLSDGEAIDLYTHALQTAELLRASGARDEVVLAGLFHDLGDARVSEKDHASWAARRVESLLGREVAYLIHVHVDAKRYLTAAHESYMRGLSPTSRRTLAEQGGPMNVEEMRVFRTHPLFSEAVLLRKCDDAGKDPKRAGIDPEPFRRLLFDYVARRT